MASDRAGIRSTPPPADGLAHRPPGAASQWDDVGLQKLWLATQKRQWRSLAVVAGSAGVQTLEVADTLAKIAWWYRGQPTCVVDLRDLSLRLVEHQLQEIAAQTQHGERVIIALRSVGENPTVVPVAELADAVIMCVELGKTSMSAARKAVDEIGRGRFLGTIVVNPKVAAAGKGSTTTRGK